MRFILLTLAVAWVWVCSKGQTIVGERMELSEAFIITAKYHKKKIVKDFYEKDLAPIALMPLATVKELRRSYREKIKKDGLKNTLSSTTTDIYKSAIRKVKSIPAAVVALKDTPKKLKKGGGGFYRPSTKGLSC